MQPRHAHEIVATKSDAKLFINDVCLRAASEMAGSDFLTHPFDAVRRTAEFTIDTFEEDWTQVGFSATKIYERTQQKASSVLYNFWAHSTMPDPEALVKAYEQVASEQARQFMQERGLDDGVTGDTALMDEDPEDLDPEDEEGIEYHALEQIEFVIDSKQRKPGKEHCYVFAEDGETLGVVNFISPIGHRWLGDSFEEQAYLETLAQQYADQFDEGDLKIMLGILGRIGLLQPPR